MQTNNIQGSYGVRRVYEKSPGSNGGVALRLNHQVVELGTREYELYTRVAAWLPSNRAEADLAGELALDVPKLTRLCDKLAEAGLLYRRQAIPATISGKDFYENHFAPSLDAWLSEGFSHPYWDRMNEGRGSIRLFTGWMMELFHYTKNANRHMPLSCAFGTSKQIKALRAKHYAEEWNHYHYFLKSLKALGISAEDASSSVPLPMTLALSNFMRQAAREDIVCYSVCSAVLEGTTVDRKQYNPYYENVVKHYGVPRAAIDPIYAHLDLDVQYQHSNLFLEILETIDSMPAARASRILTYGHQLVEHIWLWTDGIERYYGDEKNEIVRRPFDPLLD